MICEVFILFCSLNALVASADLIRQTDLGLVHGILEQWDNRSVECYHGIPYAAPPVNSLRFQPPTLHPGWNDTLNATAFGPMCPQELLDSDRIYGDEDCLRLNIFVPHDGVASSKLLPVMIWLHGGAFVLGSGNYNAHVLADFGQVIVVTINYRLGVFGFLSTGDNATTGNNGLLDQRFAILWVKTNIKNFGGNPEAIVLFGQSAGGVSVALQCLSPLNTGLFSKAILQSGVALAPRAVRLDDPSIWAKKLASILSCPVNDSYSLISCLQAKTSAELIKGAIELHSFNFEFVPTVDGLFLPKPPQELYRDTSLVNRYSYLAGVNSQEGSLAWPQIKKITSQADFFNFTSLFLQLPPDKVMMVTEAILWEYRDWTDLHHSSSHLQRQALDMVGDVSFIAPLMMTSDFLANTKKGVYIYYFTRHPNASLSPNWMGAGHGDELPFVFGVPIMGGSLVGEQELALSEQIMTYWTNFAKTSNPNSPRKSPVIWPKYNKRTARYLQLDINLSKLNIKKDLKPRRVAFWNKLFPSLLKVKECPVTKPRNDPLIKTQHGLLRGIRLQQNGKLTDIFKGIPYAQPPTGEFRFQKPRPLNSWKGIRDAKTYGNICTQDRVLTKDVHGDEDCLTLNIWIPHGIQGGHVAHQIQAFVEQSSQPQENGISNNGLLNGPFYREALQKRLAVMIWIHGGAFAIGSSLGIGVINTTIYDGRELAHQGQVIVVSVNYRLGALGFLSTGDGNARGNYGLWDQHAAMAWVKSNIANFGGNPELITIFGESAGGTCTSIHILSPVSKGLFRRAVSQSGDARAIWGVNRNPLRAARRLAQSVGCPWEDNAAMMFCLRQVPAKDIVLAIRVTELLNKEKLIFFLPFVPTIDGEFLPAEPEMLFENSKDIDYLLGCNSGDAHMFVSTWFPGVNMPFGISQAKFRTAVEKGVGSLGEDAMESVIFEYTDWENPSEFSRRQGLSQLYTDMEFCAPAFGSAQRHKMMARNASRTYVYQFSYPSRMPNLIWPEWIGALHTEELPFLFGRPFSTLQSYNQQEKQLSQAMMKYWSNFAKTGNPNYPESVPIIWPEHSTEKYYMDLNVNLVQESVGKNLRAKQFAMWNELISKMVSRNINCLEDKIPPQNGTVPEITAPTVTVQQGQMKGFISEDFLGGFLQIFLGIPYASPPVGELRFKPPKEASSWSGTLDATHLRAACPQSLNDLPRGINHTSEDCLYLNVYAPIRTSNSSLSLPVMVHIHHGSLQCGAAGAYDMKNLAAYGQVVVVEFNYRLGPLGFLTTLDVNAPGNLGFLDMSKGLQWIRGNIQSFGGDPTRVTLFGHGAGGLAVNYLLLSPLTRGLFHRAISSSGNALVTGSLAKRNDNYSDPLVATQELAKALGCPTDNNAKMVDCLRTKPVESLLDAPVPMSKYGIKFAPIIDGVFLQESPWDSLLKGNYMKIPYIIGLTNDEEGAELANLLGNDNGISTETYHKMMLGYSSAHFRYNPAQMADVIDYSYRDFNRPNDPKALRDGFRDLVQDHKWLAPSYQLTDQHSTRADTFLYIYSHPASSSRISPWIRASHLDDLLYLFGDPVAKNPTQEYNEAEKQISFRIMAYWTNFAHNGNPNEGPHRIAKWPKYTPTNREFVNFTADRSDWTGNSYRSQQTAFWNRIALKMQSKDWCNKNGEKPLPVNTTTTARPTTTRSPELCNVTQDITQDILSMNLTAEEIITAFYVSFALLFIEAFLSLGLLYKLYMQWRKLRKLQCLITPPEVFLKGITDENTPHAKF